jgi:DNA-binding transcriptional LysR family regulator
VLCARIDGGTCRSLVPIGRGNVDDTAAALGLHGAHFVLHAQNHAKNVCVERRGKAFGSLIGDRADLALSGGVVHRDIETPKPCDCLVDHDQSADIIFLADVGVDELGLRPERAQFRCASALPASSRRPATTTVAPFLACRDLHLPDTLRAGFEIGDENYMAKFGITLKPEYEADNLTSTMSLVASTGGVTVLPIYARHVLSPSVVLRPLKGEPPMIDLVIGYNRSNTSPLLKRFLARADELVAAVARRTSSDL